MRCEPGSTTSGVLKLSSIGRYLVILARWQRNRRSPMWTLDIADIWPHASNWEGSFRYIFDGSQIARLPPVYDFFLPPRAAAGIHSRFSWVELHLPRIFWRMFYLLSYHAAASSLEWLLVYWCPVSNRTFFLEETNSIRGSQVFVVCCGSPNFSSNEVRSIKRPQKTERLKSRIIPG